MNNQINKINLEIAQIRAERTQLKILRILEAEKFMLKHHTIYQAGSNASTMLKDACKFSMTNLSAFAKLFLDFCLEIRKIDEMSKPKVIIQIQGGNRSMENNQINETAQIQEEEVEYVYGLGTPEMDMSVFDLGLTDL